MVTESMSVRMIPFPEESAPEYPRKPSTLQLLFLMSYRTQQKRMCITEDNRVVHWSTWTNPEAVEITFKSNLYLLKTEADLVYWHLCHQLGILGIESRYHKTLFSKIVENVDKIIDSTPNIQNQKLMGFVLDIVSCKTYLGLERELILQASRLEFERQNYGMVPAAKEAIERIVNSGKVLTEKEDCGICLEEIIEIGAGMPCDHVFHKTCIEKWLNISHLCPLCRSELPVQTRTLV